MGPHRRAGEGNIADLRKGVDGSEWTYTQVAALEPDLILLDVNMPEEGGFEICRQLRADPRFASTPIIFLTGSDKPEDFRRHVKAGGTRFLRKGIDRGRLLAALGAELRHDHDFARPVR